MGDDDWNATIGSGSRGGYGYGLVVLAIFALPLFFGAGYVLMSHL